MDTIENTTDDNNDDVNVRIGLDLKRVFALKPLRTKFTKYDRLMFEIEQRRERGPVNYLKAMSAMRWLAVANAANKDVGALSPQQIQLLADDCFTTDNEDELVRDMNAYFKAVTKVDEDAPVISSSRFAHVFNA
ncbi:hypothetical protein [Sphingobium chungangianum]